MSRSVTIVGGGFGGVKAALELAKDPKVHVTLISNREDFQYYPTVYSSATGYSYLESWMPLGDIFGRHENVHVYIDEIVSMDAKKKQLKGKAGAIYDYEKCIIAIGVVTSYFNIPGLETYAYGIKSAEEIRKLKHRIFVDVSEHGKLDKNYVIIGAGPTGVELSASLGTYLRRIAKHYHVKHTGVKIRLIEASPRILPRSSERTSKVVTKRLRKLGVIVQTNRRVERSNAKEVVINGRAIESHTVIWTSGVTNHPFFAQHPEIFELNERDRVKVDEYLRVQKDIYVIGDNAATPYSGLAQTALRDGISVARNIKREYAKQTLKPYKPFLPITAVPVGRRWAAVEWKNLGIYGFVGGVLRRLADLLGYVEVLSLRTAWTAWRSANVYENDYFTPSGRVRTKR